MGYFSNGIEGAIYQDHFCERCVNWRDLDDGRGPGCPVWDAHLLYAYEECNSESNAAAMLDMLIPREEPGLNGNGQCTMFRPAIADPLLCACGHLHAADADNEDDGCRVCTCITWRAKVAA